MELNALLNKTSYPNLILDDDITNIKSLAEYLDFSSNLMFRHNLYKKNKTYILTLPGSPTFLASLTELNNPLLNRIYSYLVEFDPEDFSSPSREIIFFDHTVIENTNEIVDTYRENDLSTVRSKILEFFNAYYKANLDTFSEYLTAFDNKTITQLEAMVLDHKQEFNSLITFQIFPNLEPFINSAESKFEVMRSALSKICNLHSFDENLAISIISKLKDFIINDDMRINFLVNHSIEKQSKTFEILFLPRSRDNFVSLIRQTIHKFGDLGLFSPDVILELEQWMVQRDAAVSHFGLQFSNSNVIDPILYYGFMFNNVIDRPSSFIEKISY